LLISKSILITGCAGFIGFHFSERLLAMGYSIIGIDNINHYYDVQLKQARLERLKGHEHFIFEQISIEDKEALEGIFSKYQIECVVHLAAQAGVRYSLENPYAYIQSNVDGFLNLLECCRHAKIDHLIYASSSSVYGANKKIPFSTTDHVDQPVSLYAATKRANELMAYTYSHLYGLKTTGLRFFTVYGPWGRPDMSYFKFTKAIMNGDPIQVYNYGDMKRDFTYIDDIVEGMVRLLEHQSADDYKIYNIGNNQPVDLMKFISILEERIGKKAIIEFLPMQPGDVPVTFADVDDLMKDVGFKPATSINEGLAIFVEWYKDYYKQS
jgi:UDP-glucuronate 4-epimerase